MLKTKIGMLMIAVWSVALFADDTCKLSPNLFEKRASLVAKLDSQISSKKTDNANASGADIQGEIKNLDREYYRFMRVVSDDVARKNIVQLNSCCSQNEADPVGLLVCRFALYRTKQMATERFVQQFPTSGPSRAALWTLDEIANVDQSPESLPSLFKPVGPVTSYITELFRLVAKGNSSALRKYLDLYPSADGAYAELMEDQTEHLFLEHPNVVLQHWTEIKDNRVVRDLQESMSSDQKRRITTQSQKYCSVYVEPCKELHALLK